MRARRRFEKVDCELLIKLWPTRLPDKELAARLNRHRSVIRRQAELLGLKPRRVVWSELPSEV